ncbi:MAG: DUF3368 domain-containing protein [Deltaproteobacteria bacterium]|nr:DUF3368 domain-containing protein [Deltaproteobacteria bacterium]
MIVIADATPLIYLHRARHLDLLPALFREVVVPAAVAREIADGRTGPDVAALPWVRIRSASSVPPGLLRLGPGEREALALALGTPDSLVIIDDRDGREAASALGIEHIGTGAVVVLAKQAGLIESADAVLAAMQASGWWLAEPVRTALLELAGERPGTRRNG